MEHPSESILIRLAAGELPPEQRAGLNEHVAACAVCRAALEQLNSVRRLLGVWQPDAGAHDVWPALEQRLEARGALRVAWVGVHRLSRIAAIVVLGVGLGYGSTRLAQVRYAVAPTEAPRADAGDALAALGFDAIQLTSATGLYAVVDPASAEQDSAGGAP